MFCAACERETRLTPCERCGLDPLLDGRFCLQAIVARSASGRTWRAFHGAQRYAIKEYTLGGGDADAYRELVRHETALLSHMDHRGVPRYREGLVSKMGGNLSLFLVQDYIDGHTLAEELEKRGRFDVVEVLDILEELAGTLVYLHGLSPAVLHRDIKPANILRRDDDDTLVLIDFAGIRDVLRDLDGRPGAGTDGYVAPEQIKGRVSPVSDLYSLGATAVRMLTGLEPSELRDHAYQLRWGEYCDAAASVQWLIQGLVEPNAAKRARNAQELLLRLRTVRGPKGSANKRALSRTDAPSLSGRHRTSEHEPRRQGFFDEQAPVGQPLHEAKTVLAHVQKKRPTSEEAETELYLGDEDRNLADLSDPFATRADSPESDEDEPLDQVIARVREPAKAPPPKPAPPKPTPPAAVAPPAPKTPKPSTGLGSAPPLSAIPAWAALPDEPMDPDEEPTIIASRFTMDPAIAMITGATLVAEDDEELDLDEPPPRSPSKASGWPTVPAKPARVERARPPDLSRGRGTAEAPHRPVPPPPAGVKSVTIPPPEPKSTTIPPIEPKAKTVPPPEPKAKTTPPPEPKAKTTPPPEPKAKTTPPPEPKAKLTPPPEPKARTTPPPEPGPKLAPPTGPKPEPKAKTTPPPEPGPKLAPPTGPKVAPKAKTTPPPEPKAKTTPPPPEPLVAGRTLAPPEPSAPQRPAVLAKGKTRPPPEPGAKGTDALFATDEPRPEPQRPAPQPEAEQRPSPAEKAESAPPIAAFAPPSHLGLGGPPPKPRASGNEAPKAPDPNRSLAGLGLEPRLPRQPAASISADPRSSKPQVTDRKAPPPKKVEAPPEIREEVRPSFEVRESAWSAPPPPEPRDERSAIVDDYFHRPKQPMGPNARVGGNRRDGDSEQAIADWRVDEMLRPNRRTLGGDDSPVKPPSKKKRRKKKSFSTASLVLVVVLGTLLAVVIAALVMSGSE